MRKITNEELGRPSAEEFAAMEKMPVTVVLDNVRSAQNVGAFFRTGDAFAVERIVLCGITATPVSYTHLLGCLVGRRGLEGTGVFYSAAQGRDGLETAKRITMLIAPACREA